MTYRQARPIVEKRDDVEDRMSRYERTRSSTRRRARSASLSRSSPKTTDTSSNAIIITRERRNKIREKDVSDDSALSPDITDSDTRHRF